MFGLAVGLCLRYTTYYHLVPRVLLPLFPYCPSSGFVAAEQQGMGVNTPATVAFGATPSRLDARLSGRFYKVITKMPPSFFARQDWCLNLSPSKLSRYPRYMQLQTNKLKFGALWMLGTFLSIAFAFRHLVLFTVTFQPELSSSATSDFRGVVDLSLNMQIQIPIQSQRRKSRGDPFILWSLVDNQTTWHRHVVRPLASDEDEVRAL